MTGPDLAGPAREPGAGRPLAGRLDLRRGRLLRPAAGRPRWRRGAPGRGQGEQGDRLGQADPPHRLVEALLLGRPFGRDVHFAPSATQAKGTSRTWHVRATTPKGMRPPRLYWDQR